MSVARTSHGPALAVPFFFGQPGRPLFGCYAAAVAERQTDLGFVLCPPLGQDYYRAHRAVKLLATRLSALGFAVLRFDYHGCGDSAGSAEQGRLGEWLDDVASAVAEVKQRGAARVALTGLRLGGALALLAAAERCAADGLVLWDSVLDGRSYLSELEEEQRAMPHALAVPSVAGMSIDVLGFPLSEALRLDLECIDLTAVARRAAGEILIVESSPVVAAGPLAAALERLGATVQHRHLPGPAFWRQQPEGALVPHQVLQVITAWAAESFA